MVAEQVFLVHGLNLNDLNYCDNGDSNEYFNGYAGGCGLGE